MYDIRYITVLLFAYLRCSFSILNWHEIKKMVLSLQSIPYVQSNHKFVIFVVSKLLFPLFKTLDTTWEIDVANISANHVVLKVFHHSPWSHTVCEEGHRLSTHLRHDIAHSLWLLFADAKTPRHRGCISPFLRTGWQTSSLLALSSWEGTKSWILHPHKEKSRKKTPLQNQIFRNSNLQTVLEITLSQIQHFFAARKWKVVYLLAASNQ